jgi:hypothetical protein
MSCAHFGPQIGPQRSRRAGGVVCCTVPSRLFEHGTENLLRERLDLRDAGAYRVAKQAAGRVRKQQDRRGDDDRDQPRPQPAG